MGGHCSYYVKIKYILELENSIREIKGYCITIKCSVLQEAITIVNVFAPNWGFPCGSDGKESVCNVGDLGSIPGLGRSTGGGHGNPL